VIWLAHALTLARVPLAAAFVAFPDPLARLAIVALAAVTDMLDGTVARAAKRLGSTNTAGDWLDPVCDKLFVATCLVAAAPSWGFLALLCTREIVLAPLAPFVRLPRKAAPLGKLTTDAQLVTLGVLVVAPSIALPFAVVTATLGAAAAVDYVSRRTSRPTAARTSRPT
jgi:phosphatidylglycerophosphate synthase